MSATKCTCPLAGYCETHQRNMSPLLHQQCRDTPGYFEALQKPRKSIAPKPQPSRGLGDTIAKITQATGIKAVVDKVSEVTGVDCGCQQRQELLNKMFPYQPPKSE